ncbi:CxxC-x17-CxxC domain-containing protein [Nitrosopumilus sp. b2]|uniref:CxxC-x17-CxxC domain-containing protein n=1 Tax=Nitrosopumilus sp. b2 TaxID=2109908 RepID=UPI0015F4355D|nr:CxxC-x17-CxxC domain-containing protein [Nitrosopumilus sp. b2]KAF6245688.1 hypothetical protein C6989_00675 [Nitrosopumilus sp. b2]
MELYKSKYSNKKKSRRRDDTTRSFRNSRDDGYSRDRKRESATVTCADCGDECEVPFVPRTDRPVYCSDCFRQNKPQDSGRDNYSRDDRGSRYSRDDRRESRRDDRGSRYSRDDRRESSRDRPRKLKNDKFSKKRESFFSNGSDKFYATIKEKLFEILGGKVCSSCGFKDERALGFSPVSDDSSFDEIGRSGSASSWGKYISEPDLAREELKVLCLNCNEIRQPVAKPKEQKSRPKQKKSKFFPR